MSITGMGGYKTLSVRFCSSTSDGWGDTRFDSLSERKSMLNVCGECQ